MYCVESLRYMHGSSLYTGNRKLGEVQNNWLVVSAGVTDYVTMTQENCPIVKMDQEHGSTVIQKQLCIFQIHLLLPNLANWIHSLVLSSRIPSTCSLKRLMHVYND